MLRGFYLFIWLVLFVPLVADAAVPSRQNQYVAGEIISSDSVQENEDVIYNYLAAGVEVFAPLSISNSDISTTANIQSDKLNLGSIAQPVGITSAGSLDVDGIAQFDGTATANSSLTVAGNTALNGTTSTIGNGGSDTLTINAPSGLTFTPAATWTFSGSQSVSGTWANLGAVTTVDINGGTVDGTPVGASATSTGAFSTLKVGSTNQGDILYDNGTSIVRLTPGTAGQALLTGGPAANPSWGGAGAIVLQQSSTFSAVTTVTITETVGAGDVFEIIIEGTTDAGGTGVSPFGLRVNADSSGSNYTTINSGIVRTGGANPTIVQYESNADQIELAEASTTTISPSSPFMLRMFVTARGSDTQVEWVLTVWTNNANSRTTGFGGYDAGTPTSFTLFNVSGTTTWTGRYYVLKHSTS